MAFSIDFAAAYTVLAILLVCTFFTATNAISAGLTVSYAGELEPLAEGIGDVLLKDAGDPSDWYFSPSAARSPTIIGLSTGDPNILSTYKVDGLYMFNASALKKAAGLDDEKEQYGLRLEINTSDGSISRTAGYPLPPDTKDVCKSVRIASIKDEDGIYRDAVLYVYLWRKDVGAQ
ncbi:MAG TPA: hypothetical protein VMC84_08245 [Methanocella sp.]|uniref:hypothetical protein n=1 Tax=Methanocella sp. TaxID=2052833 RepID=UPI002C7FF2C4|nr:hypothetical protein [Methanocella sp.]HTY91149.1 hypothetical protein [Methanocella sp.]